MLSLFSCVLLAIYAQAENAAVQLVTIPLSSRKISSEDVAPRRVLSGTNLGLKDFFNGTDLQWFVGTPPQTLSVIFDTGRNELELASTLCGTACAHQKKFNSSKSSTFTDGGLTQNFTFGTGVGVDPIVGNNSQLTLRSAADVVSIAGLNAGNVSFFLVVDQPSTFALDPFDGVQGMGPNLTSTFGGLVNHGLPALFSMFLTPNSVGGAALTFGGIDSTKFQGDLVFTDNEQNTFWGSISSGIFVNGRTDTTLCKPRKFAFDSGTSNIILSTADTPAVYALISPNITPNAAELGTFGIPCNQTSALPAVISFNFTSQIGQPFNPTIPSSELSVGPFKNDPSLCRTLINVDDSFNIIGASLLKHCYSSWDIGKQRVGFATAGF